MMDRILYQSETEASGQCDKQEKQQRSMKKIGQVVKCNSKIEANLVNACNKTNKNRIIMIFQTTDTIQVGGIIQI